ncbi:type IV pilus biogenesis/stability protein PilW [Variovorax terrae]|uniref:Type IV pilus biogenesis/stability protein PilW n=1 Tax=Variovorax terrae TaxID=2923278 RepID=A0A9X2AMC1_9BURK|nr:type IV pilus biogenesis/stability protein PilW [Variovorax terrae]MCJ0763563.1 type IV pilus biogenesis/stability protein PilW [Variovorax terrae]
MKRSAVGWEHARQWFFWAWLAAVSLGGLAGCASHSSGPGASDSHADLVTNSDEPEARKRARIRLELATGYFEQGQTTVALDELKQAIATDPSFADAYSLRGLVYMRLNDARMAEDSFRRAISLNPRDANALHNYGWLMCQQARYSEADQAFAQVLTNPTYGDRAKTLMTQGLCQARAGKREEAERSLSRAYELDAANPVTGYNLALLLYQRSEFTRAQFYIRRLNNSELANAESLWLGVKVERRMENREAMQQLVEQLKKRYPQSKELAAYDRGTFDE